jgi:pimeloyl-ACP methyl ester carboxylesterase
MSVPVRPGITSMDVTTIRLRTRVLVRGPEDGEAVLLLHGNLSSATWWESTMLRLPDRYRAIAPDQRGFGDADPEAKIDATRGMGDLADDAFALMDHLGVDRFHVAASSAGGVAVWRMIADAPGRLLSVTQCDPGAPYGFGGTKDVDGTPTTGDFAGSGAGLVNPQLVERLAAGDDGTDSPFSPRNALRALIVRPPFVPEDEDALVASMLTVHLGDRDYPGDAEASPNWPFVAPGSWGINNALSPKHVDPPDRMIAADPKPEVLWIRGEFDLVAANGAAADPGTWGPMGLVPGYPGAEAYPPQPMVDQTRAVLDRYGPYREVIVPECGHVPYIEKPNDFDEAFHAHLAAHPG